MPKNEIVRESRWPRILSTVGLIAVALVVVVLIAVAGSTKAPISDAVWNTAMTTGDTENPSRHYIMYTDIMCPYCDVFTRATMKYEEQFRNYLADHHILFEIRMTNMIYYSAGMEFSTVAAEGSYCAAEKGEFWKFYHGAIQKLWDDYHSRGIGDSKTSPQITDMTTDWWLTIGDEAGLADGWKDCVTSGKTAATVYDATVKASEIVGGLPFFNLNGTAYNGLPSYFESWEELKKFLDTGL